MPRTRFGGVVLCGGRSRRMGRPKATLPFGSELMLQRVVRLLGEAVQPRAVVAAAEQPLPTLPSEVLIARDAQADRGPLQGLLAGLSSLGSQVEAVYVTGCDVPLLRPALVQRMLTLLEDQEIAVVKQDRFYHPLAAVYRTSLVSRVAQLLQADQLRLALLFESARTREIRADDLRDIDPNLHSLWNINSPEDYLAALAAAGLTADPHQGTSA